MKMKTFKQYCESLRGNIKIVDQAVSDLGTMLELDDEETKERILNMPYEELRKHVEEFGLGTPSFDKGRLAAMMKLVARGIV